MGSIVIYDKDGRFDCKKCIDGSVWERQGRDVEYINGRIKSKLINKGCTSDAKQPVIRLTDGAKVYRCPRSISDDYNALSIYSDYSAIRDKLFTYSKERVSWKWVQSMQIVRAELASNDKQRYNDIQRQNKQSAPSSNRRKR